MASKKLAATLGTGTLGAGGAAGAAAWKLGMGSEKSLEVEPAKPSPNMEGHQSEPPGPANEDHGSRDNSQTQDGGGTGSPDGQPSAVKTYFANATTFDKKAVDSKNWKTGETKNDGGIVIEIEEDDGNSWQCTVKGFVFGSGKDKSQIESQVKQFVETIKSDETKRNKFVKNCADARLNSEKTEGKVSTIELEVEESSGNLKLKDLDKLLNGDFVGLNRLEGNYDIDQDNAEGWIFKAEKEGPVVKLLKMKNDDDLSGELFCSICVEVEGENFDPNNFDNGALGEIFKGKSLQEQQSEEVKLSNLEKRKFLIRNCLKHNKTIEGMKVMLDSNTKKWKIKDLEEKLLTKIYEYPPAENS